MIKLKYLFLCVIPLTMVWGMLPACDKETKDSKASPQKPGHVTAPAPVNTSSGVNAQSAGTASEIKDSAASQDNAGAVLDPASGEETLTTTSPITVPVSQPAESTVPAAPTADDTVPAAPSLPEEFSITSAGGVSKNRLPDISWSPANHAESYRVVVASDASCVTTVQVFESLVTGSLTLTAPLADGVYHICVTAASQAGTTGASNNGLSLTVDNSMPPAPLEGGFSLSPAGRLGQALLAIDFPEDVSDYYRAEIRYALSAAPADCHSGAQLAVTFDGFNDYSGLIDLLPSSQPYYLRLCIWDEAGNLNDATVISGMTNNQHRIFVSSGLFSASLQQDYLNINNGAAFVSGLAGADARCQHLANEAQLGGSFKAVLSDDGISAKARLTDYGPVVNMNPAGSERVSDSIAALVNIPTSNDKVIYGETGTAYLAEIAWTGTKADGSSQPGMSCMNWSSTASENDGYVGLTGSKTSKWITFFPFGCDLPARLYCIEQFP